METYVIHVTKECNCQCLYCYETDKDSVYTWEEIKEYLDQLIKYRTSNIFSIEFLGGEPLLAFDKIVKVYDYVESYKELNVDHYTITTNGTILDDEIIKFLKDNPKVNIAISMDGHKYANQFRVFKDNISTYDKVMENIKLLQDNDIEYHIHIVSHPYNIAFLSDSIDHLYKEGVKSIDIGTVESTLKIDQEYCDRFVKELNDVSKKIVLGEYPDLSIGLFNSVKPYEDIRTYIRDEEGKTIGETYGRSGEDVSIKNCKNVTRCVDKDEISEMIYYIRKKVYDNHQENLKNLHKRGS